MPSEVKHAPRQSVADYFRLLVSDPFPVVQAGAEEMSSGMCLVTSPTLDRSYRMIAEWLTPVWQGQGSVVRQERQVTISSGTIYLSSSEPYETLEYTTACFPPRQQLPVQSGAILPRFLSPILTREPTGQVWASFGSANVTASGGFELFNWLASNQIVVPIRHEVVAYLTLHPQLTQLLPEICAQVRQVFGTAAELSLELYKDPEIDDRYLVLYVRKEKYEPEILDRIQAVNEQFNSKLEEASGYFMLATDFSRPRGSHAV